MANTSKSCEQSIKLCETSSNNENVACEDKSDDEKRSDDISLELKYDGFLAPPIFAEHQKMEDLQSFLSDHGANITKLTYVARKAEVYRNLLLENCPNISEVKLVFTEHPDEVDDDISQMLVKWLTVLAPRLIRLETVNNVIGLHYLSCMGYIYENFSSKIKFVKTDELKPEELSVLSGDNNKNNPAASLEELIFCNNERVAACSVALKPASLTDLVKLKNLRRIDLPFFLNKEKIPRVTSPLPLLTYASIRLLSHKRGNVSTSPFIKNIGVALANVSELKLCNSDSGLMVLHSIMTNCTHLEKLDLTDFYVLDDPTTGLAALAASDANPTFKQLDATIHLSHSYEIHLIVFCILNVRSLRTINIDGICNEAMMDKIIAASISLTGRVQQRVELNLTWSRSIRQERTKVPKELPSSKPDNLNISIKFCD